MARAKSLFHSANHAINFLAQSAAKKAVTEQLRDQGVRVSLVPIREITEKAQRYLADHPELYQRALERARARWATSIYSRRWSRQMIRVLNETLKLSSKKKPPISGDF